MRNKERNVLLLREVFNISFQNINLMSPSTYMQNAWSGRTAKGCMLYGKKSIGDIKIIGFWRNLRGSTGKSSRVPMRKITTRYNRLGLE